MKGTQRHQAILMKPPVFFEKQHDSIGCDELCLLDFICTAVDGRLEGSDVCKEFWLAKGVCSIAC